MSPGLLLRLLDGWSSEWCKSLGDEQFRLYLPFKRNVTEALLMSPLKSSLPEAVNGSIYILSLF